MKIFYIIMLILFLIFLSLYIFMSLRLSYLSKKKEQMVRGFLKPEELEIVNNYKKSTRVSLREIFLGIDNGKTGKK